MCFRSKWKTYPTAHQSVNPVFYSFIQFIRRIIRLGIFVNYGRNYAAILFKLPARPLLEIKNQQVASSFSLACG